MTTDLTRPFFGASVRLIMRSPAPPNHHVSLTLLLYGWKMLFLPERWGHRAGKELNEMNWFSSWLDKRRVRDLKRRIAQMKMRAEQAAEIEAELRMPTLETMTGRILQERIVVLEKAVEKIEAQPGTAGD